MIRFKKAAGVLSGPQLKPIVIAKLGAPGFLFIDDGPDKLLAFRYSGEITRLPAEFEWTELVSQDVESRILVLRSRD